MNVNLQLYQQYISLAEHDDRRKLPQELYVQLVFPALREGYKRGDVWSILGIAKTIQNVYGVDALYAAIEYKSGLDLLKEAHALEPSAESGRLLLKANIKWFKYSQHEWPSGILYGADGAAISGCDEILREIEFTRDLDKENEFAVYLSDFEHKVREYRNRLSASAQEPEVPQGR